MIWLVGVCHHLQEKASYPEARRSALEVHCLRQAI